MLLQGAWIKPQAKHIHNGVEVWGGHHEVCCSDLSVIIAKWPLGHGRGTAARRPPAALTQWVAHLFRPSIRGFYIPKALAKHCLCRRQEEGAHTIHTGSEIELLGGAVPLLGQEFGVRVILGLGLWCGPAPGTRFRGKGYIRVRWWCGPAPATRVRVRNMQLFGQDKATRSIGEEGAKC